MPGVIIGDYNGATTPCPRPCSLEGMIRDDNKVTVSCFAPLSLPPRRPANLLYGKEAGNRPITSQLRRSRCVLIFL